MINDVALTLILPWFPILLGVGIGSRLLGRSRGLFLGLISAMFWIMLVQASIGLIVWAEAWSVAAMISGSMAITVIGAWGGQSYTEVISQSGLAMLPSSKTDPSPEELATTIEKLIEEMDGFDDWLLEHRMDPNPWPAFDERIRSLLYRCCQATRIKTYVLREEGEILTPLRDPDPLADYDQRSSRRGVVGHVITTGRTYLAGDPSHGELVDALAKESPESIKWCFAVSHGERRYGVVVVGQLGISPCVCKPLITAVEKMTSQFWCMLDEVIQSRCARQHDPVSGLAIRPAFMRVATQVLSESYKQHEPVTMAVVALEGLRAMNDAGYWLLADELIQEVSSILRRKVRLDDCLGRFDGSRFILLLRRVDSELASLIVSQLMTRITVVCGDESRWQTKIQVRCGVAGSGTEQPDLNTLMTQALVQCQKARSANVAIVNDVGNVEEAKLPQEVVS